MYANRKMIAMGSRYGYAIGWAKSDRRVHCKNQKDIWYVFTQGNFV